MNPEVKNKVRENIMSVADQFGLNEIIMNSYSRQFDGQTQLSATDCAYAITSLLENPQTQSEMEKGDAENSNTNNKQQ